MNDACRFQSWISVGVSPEIAKSNLKAWWKSEGQQLLLGAGAEEDDAEQYEDEELAIESGINEDLSEQAASMPEEEQEAIYALEGAEDHAAAKRAIKDIIADLSGSSGALQDAAAEDTDMVQPASADLQPMEKLTHPVCARFRTPGGSGRPQLPGCGAHSASQRAGVKQ